MANVQHEEIFDPNSMEVEPHEQDLGDFEFEVDKMEAEALAADDAPEEIVDEAPEVAEEPEIVEEEVVEEVVAEAVEDEPEVTDELANPEENPMIPRERMNQANRKRQEEADRADNALARVADLEAQMASAAAEQGITGIDATALKNAAEKVLDGDTEAFSTILAEQINNSATKVDTNAIMEQATQNAVRIMKEESANVQRSEAADKWMSVYPELNVDGANVNSEALTEANQLIVMYEQQGYAPGVAIERAVKATAAMYNLASSEVVTPLETKAVAPKPKRKAAKVISQPPGTGEAGSTSATPAVDTTTISQDDWDALPESTREAIMNGT